jgi:hypothetical protein
LELIASSGSAWALTAKANKPMPSVSELTPLIDALAHYFALLALLAAPLILGWLILEFLLRLFGIRKLKKAVAIVLWIAVFAIVFYGPPHLWGDFTGMTEAEVCDWLGEPFRDSRTEAPNANHQEYTLGWPYSLDQGLFLTFRNGIVISQERYSK